MVYLVRLVGKRCGIGVNGVASVGKFPFVGPAWALIGLRQLPPTTYYTWNKATRTYINLNAQSLPLDTLVRFEIIIGAIIKQRHSLSQVVG